MTPFFFKEKNWNVEDIINDYVENIKKEHNDAGDIEIYTMAELLEVNIICYTLEDNKYNLQAIYSGNKLNLAILFFYNSLITTILIFFIHSNIILIYLKRRWT